LKGEKGANLVNSLGDAVSDMAIHLVEPGKAYATSWTRTQELLLVVARGDWELAQRPTNSQHQTAARHAASSCSLLIPVSLLGAKSVFTH
jgi:hypothetical protein